MADDETKAKQIQRVTSITYEAARTTAIRLAANLCTPPRVVVIVIDAFQGVHLATAGRFDAAVWATLKAAVADLPDAEGLVALQAETVERDDG